MLNKFKHTVNNGLNDFKYECGIINDREHFTANLHEDIRFQWYNFKDFCVEAKDKIVEVVEVVGQTIDNLFDSSH